MDKTLFLRNLEELIEAKSGSLTIDSILADTPGWDSMAIMGFIAFADEELGVSPAPRAIVECETVADLLRITKVG